MGRIIGYQYDDNVQDGDAWIGSEDGGGRTKQYTAEAVANYLNIQGKISIVGQMTYKYGITPLSGPGTFAVFGGGTDPVAFSAITKLTLSNTDVSKQRVVEFLNLLVGSDILISKQSAISTFGYYSIDNYAVNATDPAYYDLGVTFKSGNGSMEAEQIYETQNFTLSAEENISTLQTTIDSGNTYASGTSLWQWDPGKISQVDPDEGWGLVLSPEEGVIFTDGVGNSAGRSYLQATNLSIGNLTYTGSVFADNLTANRNFQLPNNSGTLALTTDITASPWDTVTGGINYANGNVGIGTTTPSAKLDVNGDALINGLTVGQGAGTSAFGNTVFGKTALDSITTGLRNVAIGNEALLDNTVGNYNIALGYRSLENNSASNNVAIGVEALQRVETAGNNTAVGRYTLGLTSGAGNTAIGYAAGYLRVGGTNGGSINSVFIGSLTTSNGINPENEIVIGTGAVSAGSNTVVLGNDDIVSTRLKGDVIVASGNVGIGTTIPTEKLTIAGNNKILFTGVSPQNLPASIGTDSNDHLAITAGIGSGKKITIGITGRLFEIQGSNNKYQNDNHIFSNYAGVESMRIISNGNVGIGTTSIANAKLKVSGGGVDIESSTDSLRLRFYEGAAFKSGIQQVLNIGEMITASAVGDMAIRANVGNMLFATGGSTERMRITSSGNVGIGTTSPSEKLEVAGSVKTTGTVKFYNSTSHYGSIYANSEGLNLDTVANRHMIFRKASVEVMRISTSGNVGIGTTSPGAKLDVKGAGSSYTTKAFNVENANATTFVSILDNGNINQRLVGFKSTSFGTDTGKFATSPYFTAFGNSAGVASTTNGYWTAVGASAGASSTTGQSWEAFGFFAGRLNTTGNYWNAIGSNAGENNTGGSNWIAIGYGAARYYSGGTTAASSFSNGVYIGKTAKVGAAGAQNEIVIGYEAEGVGSNSVVLGNDSITTTVLKGNVGIGTTSPGAKLHIEASDPRIKIVDADGTNWESEVFTQGGALKLQARNGTNFGNISFQGDNGTAQSEYARFNSVGNFGIGTTSPGYPLVVSRTGSNIVASFESNANAYLRIARTGVSQAGESQLRVTNNGALSITSDSNINIQTGGVSGTSRLYIRNSDGNVGIGTTSPTSKLEVAGGDIELSDVAGGITMISPDGTRYRITVANGGTLTVTAV